MSLTISSSIPKPLMTYLKVSTGARRATASELCAHSWTADHAGHSLQPQHSLTELASRTLISLEQFFPQKTWFCATPKTVVATEVLCTTRGSSSRTLELLTILACHILSREPLKTTQSSMVCAHLSAVTTASTPTESRSVISTDSLELLLSRRKSWPTVQSRLDSQFTRTSSVTKTEFTHRTLTPKQEVMQLWLLDGPKTTMETTGSARTHGDPDGVLMDTSTSKSTKLVSQIRLKQELLTGATSKRQLDLALTLTQERQMATALNWMNSTSASVVLKVTLWMLTTSASRMDQLQLTTTLPDALMELDGNAIQAELANVFPVVESQ